MANRLKLAVITDVHHGPDHETKIGRHALELTTVLIDQINNGDFDMVIEMGDRVSEVDPDTDRTHLQQVAELFMRLDPPRYHLLGNHDVVHPPRGKPSSSPTFRSPGTPSGATTILRTILDTPPIPDMKKSWTGCSGRRQQRPGSAGTFIGTAMSISAAFP